MTGRACPGRRDGFQLPASPGSASRRHAQAGQTSPFCFLGWFFFHLGPARCQRQGGCPGERGSPAKTPPAPPAVTVPSSHHLPGQGATGTWTTGGCDGGTGQHHHSRSLQLDPSTIKLLLWAHCFQAGAFWTQERIT